MPRSRIIPDARVFQTVQRLLHEGGEKAVSFSTVSAATGLAPPTLVQRYGSLSGMVRSARQDAWAKVGARTQAAIAATADKGPQALIKAIGAVDVRAIAGDLRDPDLAQSANVWRVTVEAALALRLGTGQRARESAAMLFSVWQGQALWHPDGNGPVKLKDAVKRLT
ncbi:MAG: transcriptional regulator [Rhodobacterales bacterium]|nr:transcriptional regulator [Rhodobacterales bacterium]